MSDDVTNLAEVLRAYIGCPETSFLAMDCRNYASAVLTSDWLRKRDALNRLAGAAMANSDAIAAYAELVERVEALAGEWEAYRRRVPGNMSYATSIAAAELRALIEDPPDRTCDGCGTTPAEATCPHEVLCRACGRGCWECGRDVRAERSEG